MGVGKETRHWLFLKKKLEFMSIETAPQHLDHLQGKNLRFLFHFSFLVRKHTPLTVRSSFDKFLFFF